MAPRIIDVVGAIILTQRPPPVVVGIRRGGGAIVGGGQLVAGVVDHARRDGGTGAVVEHRFW